MQNRLGVMQGRLLPKYQGRYQAHPVAYWQEEFFLADQLGLDCIEFILDYNAVDDNPLLSDKGIDEIISYSQLSGVSVQTVCADYFMEYPLHSANKDISSQSMIVLNQLIQNANKIGVSDIVIPCVDQSSLTSNKEKQIFVDRLSSSLELAELCEVNLSLETDLNPNDFAELLYQLDSSRVTVNYDIGNSAALGFNPAEELKCYGDKISDIHIKDRELHGGSIMLGYGNANFAQFFTELKKYDYSGPFIMQAFRDDEGVQVFEKQLAYICSFFPEN